MKWLIMAALTLALMFACIFWVIDKQEQLGVITKEVQTYMGQRETLQREVGTLQGIRDREVALDNAWADYKTKEGELKGKYGEKVALEGECAKLTERRDGLLMSIKAQEERMSSLERRLSDLVNQTNYLGKAMTKMLGERDSILEDTERFKGERDRFEAQRREAENRFTEQMRLSDQASERALSEKKRADEARSAADEAERRKEDIERAIKAAVAQKARIAVERDETEKEVEKLISRASDANNAAAVAQAEVEAQEAKMNALSAEIAKLEARRFELVGVTNQLAETKALLSAEREKLGQAKATVAAQQISEQIAGLSDAVSRRLGVFESKLNEFEKNHKQNEAANQGGQK